MGRTIKNDATEEKKPHTLTSGFHVIIYYKNKDAESEMFATYKEAITFSDALMKDKNVTYYTIQKVKAF